MNEAFRSAERAYLLGNNREPRSLEVKAMVQMAIADTIYHGPPPIGLVRSLPQDSRSRIATAQSMYSRAGELAQAAANHSQKLDEIESRLRLAAECTIKATEFADFLAGTPRPNWDNVTARISDVREKLDLDRRQGADKNRGALVKVLNETDGLAREAEQKVAQLRQAPTPRTCSRQMPRSRSWPSERRACRTPTLAGWCPV